MTIEINKDHFVTLTGKTTGDNYTLFAQVYKKGDKLPLFGTCFEETTATETIKTWAQMKLNTINNPLNELFTYFNL